MVLTRKGSNIDDSEENQIIHLLQSAIFAEILDRVVEKRTSVLLQKVQELETKVKIISDTNKDLITLLTNAPDKFYQKNNQPKVNAVDLNLSDSSNISDSTVIEKKTYHYKNSTEQNDKIIPTKQDQDNNFTRVYKNSKQRRYAQIQTHKQNNKYADAHINKNNDKPKKQHAIFGTGSQTKTDITAVQRKTWIYVGRVTPGTGAAGMKKHCETIFPGRQIDLEILPKWKNSRTESFKIKIDYDLLDEAFNSDNWPIGSLIKKYTFFRD